MIEVIGYVSTICFTCAYIPQLWRTWRLGTVENISIGMWWLLLTGHFSGFTYAALHSRLPLVFGFGIGVLCTGLFLLMYYAFCDREKDYARKIIREVIKKARDNNES